MNVVRCLLLASLTVGMGCQREESLRPPRLDVQAAADAALSSLDTSGDGGLDQEELKACPGVRCALEKYDADGNGAVSAEELATRLASMLDSQVGLMSASCEVVYLGQPLEGALVRFVPEPFVGDAIKTAEGETDEFGFAYPSIPDYEYEGIQLGPYRVEITHPQKSLPAKYNSQTILGFDAAPGGRGGSHVSLELKN